MGKYFLTSYMDNICYKVVGFKIEGGEKVFISSIASEDIRLEYKLNSKTTPIIPRSKIFVFKNLSNVILYEEYLSQGGQEAFVLKCKCGELKLRRKDVINPFACYDSIVDFWSRNYTKYYRIKPIKGTYLTDWVTPIEIIHEKETV